MYRLTARVKGIGAESTLEYCGRVGCLLGITAG